MRVAFLLLIGSADFFAFYPSVNDKAFLLRGQDVHASTATYFDILSVHIAVVNWPCI